MITEGVRGTKRSDAQYTLVYCRTVVLTLQTYADTQRKRNAPEAIGKIESSSTINEFSRTIYGHSVRHAWRAVRDQKASVNYHVTPGVSNPSSLLSMVERQETNPLLLNAVHSPERFDVQFM